MPQKRYPLKNKMLMKKSGRRLYNQAGLKLAEEASRRAEATLAESQRIFHLGSWDWDLATDKIQFSDEMFRLAGMFPGQAEITREVFIKLLHPDEAEQVLREILQGVTHQDSNIEHRLVLPNGEIRNMHSRVKAYKDENGVPLRLLGSTQDITHQKHMEEALRVSEERYRTVISNMPVVIFVTDEKGIFTLSEGKGLENLGLQAAQVVGQSIFDVYGAYPSIIGAMKNALEGRSQREEVEVQGIVFDVLYSPVFDQHGKMIKVVGVSTDVTERVRAQEALKKSEAQYRLLADNMTDIIWLRDLNLNLIYVSPSQERIRGYTLTELQQIPFDLHMTPASVRLAMILFAREMPRILTDRTYSPVYTQEFEFYHRDGTTHSVESKLSVIRDEKGDPTSILGQDRDITRRKQMEKALHESEARNRAMLEAIPDLVFIQDRAGVYIDYHATNRQLLVTPPEVFLGRTTRDVIPSAQVDALQLKFDLAFQTREIQTHEYVFDLADGSHHFETRMNAYDDDRLLSIVRDITERKQAEQKFLAMEELQRILLNATRLTTIALLDCAGIILVMNEYGARLIGKSPNELIGLSIYDVFPKEVADARKEKLDQVSNTAAAIHFEDSRQGISFETSMYPILDANGRVAQIAVYARDITKRKQNELLLRESEQRYRALAEASHDMIYVVDRDDHIRYVNSYTSMQLGASPDALVGQPRSLWFETIDADKTRKNLEKVFETGRPHYGEVEIVFPRGMVYLSTWLVPLKDQHGVVDTVLGVSRDISNLKKLENSLKEINLQLEARVEKRTNELRDSRDHLRQLAQQMIIVQEEERRHISRELHDEAGQALIGLRFSLDAVYKELPRNLDKLRQRIAKALDLTDKTVNRIRALAYDLRPPALDLIGVNLGIKELCREFSDQTGIKVEYFGTALEGLQDEISISLYRFVQEALTNVAKHAHASNVRVALEYRDEMIKASVQDNGRGMPAENGRLGLGMVGIKERFETLGGWLEVKSLTPAGTQLQVCLPWKDIRPPA